ncbi:MAG: sugar transferase [bacterium]
MIKYSNSICARIFDVVGSVLLIIVLSPLLIIISLIIKLDGTGGSVLLLSPERIKMGGKIFRMYKFRYMIPDAHEKIKNGEFGKKLLNKWEKQGGKLDLNEDPRVTFVGRILRATDMDELPQLFNVLKGDMSLVGPRPYIEDEIPKYKLQFPKLKKKFKNILSVKPGITGLWQVSGRNSLPLKDRIELDAECARRKSLLFDIWILIRTPYVVITRKGAM